MVSSGARKVTADQGRATFADVADQEAAVTELWWGLRRRKPATKAC